MYKMATMMTTISVMDKSRGNLYFSSHFTNGYITKASNIAIMKGKITDEAIFSTAPIRKQQIKIIREKIARPE